VRTAFIQEFIRQAREHPDLFLVVGDLGFSVVEPFAAEFPDRFLNAGVAEQNMTGLAAGLAASGYHVFTYSIANFPTLRCLEQIRNDVCYHGLPVTVVSVGAGLSYGNLGYSHHAVQDLGILRTLGELTVLSPADPGETRACVRWLANHPGPSYLRLGKAGEPELHAEQPLEPVPVKVLDGNAEVALVATGSVLKSALEAARAVHAEGWQVPVFSCPWLQPADERWTAALAGFRCLLAVEEHVAAGGLASLLRDALPPAAEVRGLAVPLAVTRQVGSQEYLRRQAGLDAAGVLARLRAWRTG
jgi:transketolase